MQIEQINDLANAVMVARLEIETLEREKESILANFKTYQAILTDIEVAKLAKEKAQQELLQVMADATMLSWKTEQASFSRVIKKTAQLNPAYKKAIEQELKKGVEIDGWSLNKTDYLSIKLIK